MTEARQKNIDRMVDGELDRSSERQLLLECEERGQWRDLALAFVEARSLKRELCGLFVTPPKEVASQDPLLRKNGTNAVSRPSHTSLAGSNQQAEREKRNRPYWWSLATAVLLSLGVGYSLGWDKNSNPASKLAEQQATFRTEYPESLPSSMQITVNHPKSAELQQVEIPLMRASDLGPDWQERLRANGADSLVREMQQQGLNLRQQRTFTPVRLRGGQRVIVPVDYYYEQPYQ